MTICLNVSYQHLSSSPYVARFPANWCSIMDDCCMICPKEIRIFVVAEFMTKNITIYKKDDVIFRKKDVLFATLTMV